jgi:hypothetical protein
MRKFMGKHMILRIGATPSSKVVKDSISNNSWNNLWNTSFKAIFNKQSSRLGSSLGSNSSSILNFSTVTKLISIIKNSSGSF